MTYRSRTKSVEAVLKKQRNLLGFLANSGSFLMLKKVHNRLACFERKMPSFIRENCF
jgi:hypothetical protein